MKKLLSEYMEAFKLDRPSEFLMGDWIRDVKQLEADLEEANKQLRGYCDERSNNQQNDTR